MTNNKPGSFQSQHHSPAVNPFAKSPFEMGGSKSADPKAQSLGEHLDSALNFVADSLFGFGGDAGSSSSKQSDNNSDSNSNSSNPFAEALKREQEKNGEMSEEMKQQKHLAKHKEMQMTEVFDLEKKQSEEMIRQIKEELSQLIQELNKMSANVDQSIHTAVFQGKKEQGKYYVNFFTQLRNFLILFTKRVKEGNTWLQSFNTKRGKSVYEQRSAQYGSQYQFGQEGQGFTRQSG